MHLVLLLLLPTVSNQFSAKAIEYFSMKILVLVKISVVFDVLKSKNPELLVVIVRCKSNPVVTLVAQAVCII
jgi:hypothetical protein